MAQGIFLRFAMDRRHFCQALAVLPLAGLLLPREASGLQPFKEYLPPGVWCGTSGSRVKVEWIILPTNGKFEPWFQKACENWLRENPEYRPIGEVEFEPCLWDASPWLLHPSWTTPDSPLTLVTPAEEAFRRPRIIDRAIALRAHLYWRADCPPLDYSKATQAELDDRWLACRAWQAGQRLRLAYVVVRFDAEPV